MEILSEGVNFAISTKENNTVTSTGWNSWDFMEIANSFV